MYFVFNTVQEFLNSMNKVRIFGELISSFNKVSFWNRFFVYCEKFNFLNSVSKQYYVNFIVMPIYGDFLLSREQNFN